MRNTDPPTKPPPRSFGPFTGTDLLSALAVVIIWGLNFVAMKLALRDFTPFQLGAARYVFAVLPLVFFVRPPRLPWPWLLMAGLSQLGQFALLFVGLKVGMTAALASVLIQTQLFFTVLLGALLLGERLSMPARCGLGLAALGLGCFGLNTALAATPGAAAQAVTGAGLVLCLGAAAMWAVANIVARKAQQRHPGYGALQYVVWSSLVPVLPFMALAWWFEPPATRWHWLQAGATAWVGVAYLGWFATIAAYAMWTALLKRHPAGRVAPFGLAVPLVGLGAGMLVLGETISALQWVGSACVVGALVVVMTGGRFARRA